MSRKERLDYSGYYKAVYNNQSKMSPQILLRQFNQTLSNKYNTLGNTNVFRTIVHGPKLIKISILKPMTALDGAYGDVFWIPP